MDRQAFDKLYSASPRSAIRRALAGELDPSTLAGLREHVDDLNTDDLLQLLGKLRSDDETGIEPFIDRLVDVIAASKEYVALQALELSTTMNRRAWADLTRKLRDRGVVKPIWYFFVDKVRGGEIFNALNVPPPGLVFRDYLGPIAANRPEPIVASLLRNPDDDIAAREYVLSSCSMDVVLFLHEQLGHHFSREVVELAAAARAKSGSDRWHQPLPSWMAKHVSERLHGCGDEEAVELYGWLLQQPPDVAEYDSFDVALERLRKSPLSEVWHAVVGSHLATGKDWKKRGRAVLEFYTTLNIGFPPQLLTAALQGAAAKDGATPDEHRRAILRVIHDEAAKILVRRAEDAMKGADWNTACQTFEALQCLDPGKFIRGPLRGLKKIPDVPRKVLDHIEACEELARAGGKLPSDQAILDAFTDLRGGRP